MIRTNRAVGVGRSATTTEVGGTIEADDWIRNSDLTDQPLHSRIRDDRTDWPERNRALLLVLALCILVPQQRFHAAQGRRDIEFHNGHDAAILGVHNRLCGTCRTGLSRRRSLRKQDNCDCRKAKQKANYYTEFKECRLGSGFLFHCMEFVLSGVFVETRRSGLTIFVFRLLIHAFKDGASLLPKFANVCQSNFWLFLQGGFICRGQRPYDYEKFLRET